VKAPIDHEPDWGEHGLKAATDWLLPFHHRERRSAPRRKLPRTPAHLRASTRPCDRCGTEFTPTGPTSKICKSCKSASAMASYQASLKARPHPAAVPVPEHPKGER
jgi:hypothetical protein